MMRFEFATATRIIFGAGTLAEIATLVPAMGTRALIVTGQHVERAAPVTNMLAACHVPYETCAITGEPTIATVTAGVAQARAAACDIVLGVGGGSPLDAGKAIAALLTNPGEPLDYLEVIGRG